MVALTHRTTTAHISSSVVRVRGQQGVSDVGVGLHELEGRVDVDGYEGGLVAVVVIIAVDVSGAGYVAAAGAGAVAIVDAVVVVVRIFCAEGRSWWTKTTGGARRVGGDKVRKEASRGRAAIVARAVVLNKSSSSSSLASRERTRASVWCASVGEVLSQLTTQVPSESAL